MNDRYLFRGKTQEGEQWVQGFLVGRDGRFWIENDGVKRQVEPLTIGQSSGEKYKNGTLIFEGDLLTCKYNDHVYKVEWDPCRFIGRGGGYCLCISDETHNHGAMVIGNIHDSPKLLEVQA